MLFTGNKHLYIGLAVSALGLLTVSIVRTSTTAEPAPRRYLEADTNVKSETLEINLQGKKIVFIGDSHTANSKYGWQTQLSKQTGAIMKNTAVGGKMTPWMVEIAKKTVDTTFDYCFVYGGANDCYSNRDPRKTLKNLQKIADYCDTKKVECYILTGFNPYPLIRTTSNYPKVYDSLQRLMLTELKNCTVVDCRQAITEKNCEDWVCHMNYKGHKSMAEHIIKTCHFKNL
jgi:hypothetical protein